MITLLGNSNQEKVYSTVIYLNFLTFNQYTVKYTFECTVIVFENTFITELRKHNSNHFKKQKKKTVSVSVCFLFNFLFVCSNIIVSLFYWFV